jgi:hypothetical protein
MAITGYKLESDIDVGKILEVENGGAGINTIDLTIMAGPNDEDLCRSIHLGEREGRELVGILQTMLGPQESGEER